VPAQVLTRELARLRRAVTPLLSATVVEPQERLNGKRTKRTFVVASLRERVDATN